MTPEEYFNKLTNNHGISMAEIENIAKHTGNSMRSLANQGTDYVLSVRDGLQGNAMAANTPGASGVPDTGFGSVYGYSPLDGVYSGNHGLGPEVADPKYVPGDNLYNGFTDPMAPKGSAGTPAQAPVYDQAETGQPTNQYTDQFMNNLWSTQPQASAYMAGNWNDPYQQYAVLPPQYQANNGGPQNGFQPTWQQSNPFAIPTF